MIKPIKMKAGERVTVYRRNLSSVPVQVHFDATAPAGTQLQGEVTIFASNWIFPKPPVRLPLQAHNIVHAGFWDTFFRVVVTAHNELEITMLVRAPIAGYWIIGVGFVVAIALLMFWLT